METSVRVCVCWHQTHNLILQVSSHLVNLFGGQKDASSLLERFDETHHPGLHGGLTLSNRLLDLCLLWDGGHLYLELSHLLIPLLHLGLHCLEGKRKRTRRSRTAEERESRVEVIKLDEGKEDVLIRREMQEWHEEKRESRVQVDEKDVMEEEINKGRNRV